MSGTLVGIVVNPMSGRDIRRLIAHASVFPNAEKANMVQRLFTALGGVGVDRVLVSTDLGGVSAAVLRAVRTRGRRFDWPDIEFVDADPISETAQDTVNAVSRMVAAGAGAVICLGGDGTARVAARAVGEVPLVALSTGTNNVFPHLREATVTGLAAGLVATGAVGRHVGTYRAKMLEVAVADQRDRALVDVCVTTAGHRGARALWDPAILRELFCTFAEPDAIGLSSIAGLLCPSPRTATTGIALRLEDPVAAATTVLAPIAPGLLVDVGVQSWRVLAPDDVVEVATERGVIALDGEREIEYDGASPTVRLVADGPVCIDVPAVLTHAAAAGLLVRDRSATARAERATGELHADLSRIPA